MIVGERDRSGATATGLDVALDRPLPESVPIGRRTAVFCVGTCFHPDRRVEDLAIVVDGIRHRPTAQRMPRPDRACYRSGFWATIPIEPPNEPGELTLIAEARLDDGTTATAPLGTIAVVDPPAPIDYERPSPAGRKPLIAICMATYNPNLDLFHAQVESIRGQTDTDWICLISDDCSAPEQLRGDRRGRRRRRSVHAVARPAAPQLLPELRAGAVDGARRRPSSSPSATTTIAGTRTSSRR